jgi:hypothetical protein
VTSLRCHILIHAYRCHSGLKPKTVLELWHSWLHNRQNVFNIHVTFLRLRLSHKINTQQTQCGQHSRNFPVCDFRTEETYNRQENIKLIKSNHTNASHAVISEIKYLEKYVIGLFRIVPAEIAKTVWKFIRRGTPSLHCLSVRLFFFSFKTGLK